MVWLADPDIPQSKKWSFEGPITDRRFCKYDSQGPYLEAPSVVRNCAGPLVNEKIRENPIDAWNAWAVRLHNLIVDNHLDRYPNPSRALHQAQDAVLEERVHLVQALHKRSQESRG